MDSSPVMTSDQRPPEPDNDSQNESTAGGPPEKPFKPLGKSPKKALLLSLIPGLGHIYVGQVVAGSVFLISNFLSLFLVASACFGLALIQAMQDLATSFHIPYNTDFGSTLTSVSMTHPAVCFFVLLYFGYVLYVGQDAYLYAARGNSPIYPPTRNFRLAPVFGGSYLMHCTILVALMATAFLVAAKKPPDAVTVIDMILEEPPPPPKEKPIPEPPKPKAQKVTPKQELPKPVQQPKPTPKPAFTPPVIPDTPVPIAAVPTTPGPATDSAPEGTGTGDSSAKGEPSDGGGGDGDEADFSGYLAEMEKRIRKAWFPPRGNEDAKIVVAFKLNGQGKVSGIRLKTSSGLMIADTAATDAIKNAGPFGSLPKGAPDKVDIVFTFDYTVFNGGRASLKN